MPRGRPRKNKVVEETKDPIEKTTANDKDTLCVDPTASPPTQWTMVRSLSSEEPCRSSDCSNMAIAVYQNTSDPSDEWNLCESCGNAKTGISSTSRGTEEQNSVTTNDKMDDTTASKGKNDPAIDAPTDESAPDAISSENKTLADDVSSPTDNMNKTDENEAAPKEDSSAASKSNENVLKAEKEESPLLIVAVADNNNESPAEQQPVISQDTPLAGTSNDDKTLAAVANEEDAMDVEDEKEEDPDWDMKKVLSIDEITNTRIMCSHANCDNIACCLYVGTETGTKFYYCLDCQNTDYGGWPEANEIPVDFLTEDHKKVMLKYCSSETVRKWEWPILPDSPPLAKGVIGDDGLVPSQATATPPPAAVYAGKKKGKASKITPTPGKQQPKVVSQSQMALHAKFQKAAEEMGGPGARVIFKKEEAKPLVFQMLHDSFRPMNITDLFNALKATVPSPVLRGCLDEMTSNDHLENPFADSDDDEDDGAKKNKKSKTGKSDSTDPYANSLRLKAGRNSNNQLYYVDYSKIPGLDPEAKNQLYADVAKAEAEEARLKSNIQKMDADTAKLLSEPTNEELDRMLDEQETAMVALREQVAAARKHKVNEKTKKQLKKRIEGMTAHWRKRKRQVLDFLNMMEESTEGAVSVKKCLAGDGQIEIDSDEAVIQGAIAFAQRKRLKTSSGKPLKKTKGLGGATKSAAADETDGLSPDPNFVGVRLDAHGQVARVYLDESQE